MPVTVTGVATSVYVVQQPTSGTGAILQFSATASGTVNPTATLTMPSGFSANCVATDNTGQIYVGGVGSSGPSVLVFAAGASGQATPTRTILAGATANFQTPVALTLDSGGLLYVLGVGTSVTDIAVYSLTPGASTLARHIVGSATGLSNAQGIAVDGSSEIFVTTGNGTTWSVLVFSGSATANVAPARTITQVNGVALTSLEGIAADSAGDIYVVNYPVSGPPGTIVAFAAGANGNAAPVKTIGGASTGLMNVGGLALDGVGTLYVVGSSAQTAPYGLTVSRFSSTATGNVQPAGILTSASWTQPGYGQVAAF